MSQLRANEFANSDGDGSPSFPFGADFAGITTAVGIKATNIDISGISTFSTFKVTGAADFDGDVTLSSGIFGGLNITGGDLNVTGGNISVDGNFISGGKKLPISSVSNTEPTSPDVGDLWTDISVIPSALKIYNGSTWVEFSTGSGGGVSFAYKFITSNSDPSSGELGFDNNSLDAASTLKISKFDSNSVDIESYLTTVGSSDSTIKGHIKISDLENPDLFALFSISSSSGPTGDYFTIQIAHLSGETTFADGKDLIIAFSRTGDKGNAGTDGTDGTTTITTTNSVSGSFNVDLGTTSSNEFIITKTDPSVVVGEDSNPQTISITTPYVFGRDLGDADGGNSFLVKATKNPISAPDVDSNGESEEGLQITRRGKLNIAQNGAPSIQIRRNGNNGSFPRKNGSLISFYQNGGDAQNINELVGTISVDTLGNVTLNGSHLSRWSQLPDNADRIEIKNGTLLTNLDEMCAWGTERNVALNRMEISSVEGDANVAGVFQDWDDDDEVYTKDFYCAMTGDYIIRIAQGTNVSRGDLLMSAGDGTAKPQGDDIVRSKTVAKVTSSEVTVTYDDGSYCVPCVLMAC